MVAVAVSLRLALSGRVKSREVCVCGDILKTESEEVCADAVTLKMVHGGGRAGYSTSENGPLRHGGGQER